MSLSATIRKNRLLFAILILSSALSGCASMAGGAIESMVENVVETTVDVVIDTTVDVILEPAFDAVVEATVVAAIACIDNDKPVLSATLPNPVLNQAYSGLVHVGIRNEPYDDSYDYTFELSGHLPPGIRTVSAGRQLRLAGTPKEPGEYNFKIKVTVEDGPYGSNDTAGLCYTVDNESFQWSIQQT